MDCPTYLSLRPSRLNQTRKAATQVTLLLWYSSKRRCGVPSMAITWRNFESGIEHSIAFQPPDTKHLMHHGQALSRRSVGSFEGAAAAQHSDSVSMLHGTSKPDQGYPQSPAGKRHKPQAPLTLSALLKVQGAEFTPANSYALSEAR